MATIAFDSSSARGEARPSICRHPAFPTVVATWFAALLGAGTMILPVVLLERVVDATGLAALVPAAAAPLGLAARGLVAMVSAIAGALAGHAIARRVARANDDDRRSQDPGFASSARRPISVNEELGGEGLASSIGLPVIQDCTLAIADPTVVGELDLVQLVQRLGASIERRREAFSGQIPSPALEAAQPEPFTAPDTQFAARSPTAHTDTDAALREALATLRRMRETA